MIGIKVVEVYSKHKRRENPPLVLHTHDMGKRINDG